MSKGNAKVKRKVCAACDKVISKRSMWRVHRFFPLWTCQGCQAECCEHYCSLKDGTSATCANCQRSKATTRSAKP